MLLIIAELDRKWCGALPGPECRIALHAAFQRRLVVHLVAAHRHELYVFVAVVGIVKQNGSQPDTINLKRDARQISRFAFNNLY